MDVFVFGDSHGEHSFKGMGFHDRSTTSVTMHRVGRDGMGFLDMKRSGVRNGCMVILHFGEVDCRCHIKRQLNHGREYQDVLTTLVSGYVDTIQRNLEQLRDITVVLASIIPPVDRELYESVHGPITHEFPFEGTNQERSRFTQDLNRLLAEACQQNGWYYFDYHTIYADNHGMLRPECSDGTVHLGNNEMLRNKFQEFAKEISGSGI